MDKKNDKNKVDFWQDHSLHYLEMAFRTDKRKIIKNPAGCGKRTGECGDTVEIFLKVRNNRIHSITFDTKGCMNTNACANTVACLAEGRTIEEAWEITAAKVVDDLKTLPSKEVHCAELVVGTLYLALSDFQKIKHSPWKKMYKKH